MHSEGKIPTMLISILANSMPIKSIPFHTFFTIRGSIQETFWVFLFAGAIFIKEEAWLADHTLIFLHSIAVDHLAKTSFRNFHRIKAFLAAFVAQFQTAINLTSHPIKEERFITFIALINVIVVAAWFPKFALIGRFAEEILGSAFCTIPIFIIVPAKFIFVHA